MSEFVIDIRGLTKIYRDTAVLDNVTFQVSPGTIYALLGSNGSGKTTLIKAIVGLLRPSSGAAFVLGQPMPQCATFVRQKLGFVPERQFIHPWMRVRDVLWFASKVYRRWNVQEGRDLVQEFELDLKKKVHQLSKGMLSKLALLLALAHQPELLVFDEPTSGLDPLSRTVFLEHVKQAISKRSATVLFSTHVLGDVEGVATNIGVLREGQLRFNSDFHEAIQTTKRISAVISPGKAIRHKPAGLIWERWSGQRWEALAIGFSSSESTRMQTDDTFESISIAQATFDEALLATPKQVEC